MKKNFNPGKEKFLIGLASILAVLSFVTFGVYQVTTNAQQSCADLNPTDQPTCE